MLLYEPIGRQDTTGEPLPTHIRTPDGREYGLTDEALLKEIATRHRADVELMQLSHGIFDEAGVSAITLGTIRSIAREAGHDADVHRFRPNLVIDKFPHAGRIAGCRRHADVDVGAAGNEVPIHVIRGRGRIGGYVGHPR